MHDRKKTLLCVIYLLWLLCLLPSRSAKAADMSGDSFRAFVLSDLHYTTDKTASDLIVSGISRASEITDIIVQSALDANPDAFIMTGDNTNSGSEKDTAALIERLRPLKVAGIRLVVTPGNHDFNHMSPDEYEKLWSDLVETDDRDPASLSYTAVFGDVVLLAMDDSSYQPDGPVFFSSATMDWLKKMVLKYEDRHLIFLSHHSVLLGKDDAGSGSYRIQNPELPGFLEGHGVRLAMTGHFHAQIILEENGLYEIVSAMPFGSAHLTGFLSITGSHVSYEAQPIDFKRYGAAEIANELTEKDERTTQLIKSTFAGIVSRANLSKETQEQILALTVRFLNAYTEGTLAENMEAIKGDPVCELMIQVLWDHNYGPWMQSVLEQKPLPARALSYDYNG